MSLRTTNIIVFLVCLNSAAALMGATGFADVGAAPEIGGGEEIQDAQDRSEQISTDRSALDQFVNGLVQAGQSLSVIFEIATAGPDMFRNLGVPDVLVTFIAAPLYILVGLDILQVLSGRDIA
jgi:hypothetical protein